jgi:DNA invertase Pin-like site-specific DNA recombinase
VIEQGIDTVTVEGHARFGMLSVLAELQRELIVANTMDGLTAARARARMGCRRPSLTEDQAALAQQLYDERVADLFDVPRFTVYGRLEPREDSATTAQ